MKVNTGAVLRLSKTIRYMDYNSVSPVCVNSGAGDAAIDGVGYSRISVRGNGNLLDIEIVFPSNTSIGDFRSIVSGNGVVTPSVSSCCGISAANRRPRQKVIRPRKERRNRWNRRSSGCSSQTGRKNEDLEFHLALRMVDETAKSGNEICYLLDKEGSGLQMPVMKDFLLGTKRQVKKRIYSTDFFIMSAFRMRWRNESFCSS